MVIREFTVNEPHDETLRRIVAERADLVAFSCYIWNIEETLRLAADLKQVLPGTFIVLGGPEASFGMFEIMERNLAVDSIIRGEGEETFRELVGAAALTGGSRDALQCVSTDIPGLVFRAGEDIIATPERAPLPDLDAIPSPFAAGFVDLAKPLVYVETSRGCPFSCAFCMSSLERGVRSFSPERIRDDLRLLMERKARTVKLVDRTFNFDARRANGIWDFILNTNQGSSFHFEIAADLLTEENFTLLETVPPGLFRFEIGVQSGKEETLERVGRQSDLEKLSTNVRRLIATTQVIVHLDLVAGLPHEDYGEFLCSLQKVFDLLSINNPYFFACQGGKEEAPETLTRPSPLSISPPEGESTPCPLPPGEGLGEGRATLSQGERGVRRGASDEANAGRRKKTACFIQVEPLKVLKGSPMRKIARDEGYRFSAAPPYKILQTPWLSFEEICRIEAISRLIDLFYNSGRFTATLALLARTAPLARMFDRLAEFRGQHPPDAGRSLAALFEELWSFGEEITAGDEREMLREAICYDYCLTEYPAARRLPRFFPEGMGAATFGREEKLEVIARRLGVTKDCRVRTFGRRFVRDPRRPGGEQGGVDLLFVYISTPGKGLEVRVLEESQ
jgi:hypothetical protein